MARVLPRLGFLWECCTRSAAPIETWLRQDTQGNRRAMQPAAVLGRVMARQASCEPAGLFGGQGRRERGDLRRVEMIAHQVPLVGSGSTVLQQMRALVRPGHCGALCGEVGGPPPPQGLGAPPHVGRPAAFVGVIVPLGLARLGGSWRAGCLSQRHRLCLHGDQRVPGIIGALRERQDLCPVGHTIGVVRRGKHPTLVAGRLAEGFLIVCRPVASEMVSTMGRATR
jgi:hypothetical protein